MVSVRRATPRDTEAAVEVVRRSIEELCVADHHNDAATLAKWLANKTPENFRSWISNPDNFCVIAEDVDGRLCGVGLVDRSGEIKLFYLAPGSQGRGIGRAVHAVLEEQAQAWGLPKLHLDSTILARPFYEAMGYKSLGEAKNRFCVLQCYPYEKLLN